MEFNFSNLQSPKNVSRFSNIELGKAGSPAGNAVYNLKGSFLGWLVCSLRFSVNKGYRERVIESRREALETLSNSAQMRRELATLQAAGRQEEMLGIEERLRGLENDVGHGRRFFRGVQELVRSVNSESVVRTAGKRSGWAERTKAPLDVESSKRYSKFNARPDGDAGQYKVGLGALDYMTEAIRSDDWVVPPVANNPDLRPESRVEAQERALLAMSFLKFLTIEPHTQSTKPLFRWEKTKDLVELRDARHETVRAEGKKPAVLASQISEVLVPDKKLQKYVVACFDKCQYEKEQGVLVDFRLFEANSGENSLAEGVSESVGAQQSSLDGEQQKWVTGQLKRFLQ